MAISSESVPAERRRPRSVHRVRAGLLAVLISISTSLLIVGCGEPQVGSDHRELLLQLATASSTRDAGMMGRVAADVDRLAAAGELTDGEQTSFRAIIDAAGKEDWDRAQELAYALRDGQHPTAEDQERVAKRTLREIKKPSGRAPKP